eukprot:4714429-Amphidinium_carterae.1
MSWKAPLCFIVFQSFGAYTDALELLFFFGCVVLVGCRFEALGIHGCGIVNCGTPQNPPNPK